jgi:hypothetical protein
MKAAKPAQADDWGTEPLPAQHATITLDRAFCSEEMERIRRGVVPQEMEDKWFIYEQNGALFFHRSWTGRCIYVVRFVAAGDQWKMVQAQVNRDPSQCEPSSDEHDALMISYLIDVLLLGRAAEFPCDESSPEKRALMNWAQVGRAMFGQHFEADKRS